MTGAMWEFAGVVTVQVASILAVWLKISADGRRARDAAAALHHETQPNSGKTLRDAVNRIEAQGQATAAQVAELTRRVDHYHRPRPGRRR